ncbi:MAG: helix-turn-helix domain-containing protein [Chitinivibrionales bacterium]|nr:helix-turn-helix domain-containing protein [Chitinivibrionales bacterium]
MNDRQTQSEVPVYEDSIASYDTVPFAAGGGTNASRLIRAHTHYGVEIGTTVEGRGKMYLNGRELEMGPGDVYFVDASIPHWHYGADDTVFSHCWVCAPLTAVVSPWPAKPDLRLYLPFVALRHGLGPIIRGAKTLASHVREIHRLHVERPEDWDLLAWPRVVWALGSIYRATKPVFERLRCPLAPQVLLSVMPAVEHVNRHFTEALTVKDLARLCNLSVSRFSHLFTEAMGVSPIQYRNQLRINYAIERLTNTADALPTIAAESGFQSVSQFRDSFQRITGSPPGAFRKRMA